MKIDVSELEDFQIFYWIWWHTKISPNPLLVNFFYDILTERKNGQTHSKR